MTMQTATVPPPAKARTRVQVVAWVDEQTLSERRAHLRVGQDLETLSGPVRPELAGGFLRDLPEASRTCLQLHPDEGEEPASIRSVRGQVAEIVAVVVPHRRRSPTAWEPIPGAARCRPVESTCTPDLARSVWIPSGNPVLLGFLVTIEDACFTHHRD